ncbi:hypothetical protein ACOSP7_026746 [Xanthoceras sorbifolium]
MADGVQMRGSFDRNIDDNGGDMARGLNDTAVQHISAKGKEKIEANNVQDFLGTQIGKDADSPSSFQGLKKAENVGAFSRPDFLKSTTIKPTVNLEIHGSDPRVVSTNDTLLVSEEVEPNKQSNGDISMDLD